MRCEASCSKSCLCASRSLEVSYLLTCTVSLFLCNFHCHCALMCRIWSHDLYNATTSLVLICILHFVHALHWFLWPCTVGISIKVVPSCLCKQTLTSVSWALMSLTPQRVLNICSPRLPHTCFLATVLLSISWVLLWKCFQTWTNYGQVCAGVINDITKSWYTLCKSCKTVQANERIKSWKEKYSSRLQGWEFMDLICI